MFRVRTGRSNTEWAPDAISLLQRYAWPGNVRELANIVERLVILHAGQRVTPREIAQVLPTSDALSSPPAVFADFESAETSLTELLDEYERALIVRALSGATGNVAEAARRLKTDRPNLYRRMKRLGLTGDPAAV